MMTLSRKPVKAKCHKFKIHHFILFLFFVFFGYLVKKGCFIFISKSEPQLASLDCVIEKLSSF